MSLPLKIRSWIPHLALLTLVLVEYQRARASHLTREELTLMLSESTGREKAWAMHVLANRDDPSDGPLTRSVIQDAILDPDPWVADMVYTADLCRLLKPSRQEKRLSVRFDDPEKSQDKLEDWFRRFAFYRRKVGGRPLGGSLRLKQQEVQWLLQVLRGDLLDEGEVIAYLERRQAGTNSARMQNLKPNKKRDREDRSSAGRFPGR